VKLILHKNNVIIGIEDVEGEVTVNGNMISWFGKKLGGVRVDFFFVPSDVIVQIGDIVDSTLLSKEINYESNEQLISKYQDYLNETDWYIVRDIESGKLIPQDVLDKRKLYRDEISRLRLI
jgi:formylmethanofuran dehydrogenase subunit C